MDEREDGADENFSKHATDINHLGHIEKGSEDSLFTNHYLAEACTVVLDLDFDRVVAQVGRVLLEGGHVPFEQLLNRLGDAPRDLFPSSMSFLNAPPVDHTTDLGLSQFQRDLQQSHFAADLPAMSRLAEKKSQDIASDKMDIVAHVNHALLLMSARRLISFRPFHHVGRLRELEFAMQPWRVLRRLRYPQYIAWATRTHFSEAADRAACESILVRVAAAGYLRESDLDAATRAGHVYRVLTSGARGFVRVLDAARLRADPPLNKPRRGESAQPVEEICTMLVLNEDAFEEELWYDRMVTYVTDVFGPVCGSVMRVVAHALDFASFAHAESGVPLTGPRVRAMCEKLGVAHDDDWKGAVRFLAHKSRGFISEEDGGLRLQRNAVATAMAKDYLRRVVFDTYGGANALRVWGALSKNRLMEERDVAKTVLMNDKDVRAMLLQMLRDDIVLMQEVPKTSDHTVLRTYYLYGVDEGRAFRALHLRLSKTLQNLLCRLHHVRGEADKMTDKFSKIDTSEVQSDLGRLRAQMAFLKRKVALVMDDLVLLDSTRHSELVRMGPERAKRGKKKAKPADGDE